MFSRLFVARSVKMGLANLYIDASSRSIFPDATTVQRLWNEWLWGTDCNAMVEERYGDMNQMHIMGIFLALLESMSHEEEESPVTVESLLIDIPLVHLYKKPISQYSLRELTNQVGAHCGLRKKNELIIPLQVECLQLSWGQVLSHGDFDACCKALRNLFARFGYIIHRAYPNTDDSILDDTQYMTQIPCTGVSEEKTLFITTRKFIRQMVSVFFALFRALFIISTAEIAPTVSEEMHSLIKSAFKTHHIESSSDFFNNLQQVICLAPGMRLVYRTNFSGMYNDISQVVYYHHPKFAKQPQLKLQEILLSSLNTLPLLTQLFPQINVCYDDDSFLPFLSDKKPGKMFYSSLLQSMKSKNDSPVVDVKFEDFIQKRMEERMEELSQRPEKPKEAATKQRTDGERYCWLICCSSVFLIDVVREKILSSYDASIVPLIAYMAHDVDATIGSSLSEHYQNLLDPQSLMTGAVKMDLDTAHGHVCLL